MNIPYHVMIISYLSTWIFSHFLSAITFLSQTLNNKFKSSGLDLPPPFVLAAFHQLPRRVCSFVFVILANVRTSWSFASTTLMQVSMAKDNHHCIQLLVYFLQSSHCMWLIFLGFYYFSAPTSPIFVSRW